MERAFRSNCLAWALQKLRREGGYITMRRSVHWRWIPHFLWSKDLRTWEGFTPVDPKENWRALYDCLWFVGTVEPEGPSDGTVRRT